MCLTESSHEIMRLVYLHLTGRDRRVPDYYGEDIIDIMRAYKEIHPNAPLSI